ncbi:unnamed protein product [Brassicogethes aeneus]|uniref:Uncharacterized protein n=1 Tax=Brassicogethes aeneus TaxID=1431903 RepID=A0A9P0AQC1_BRAAE|nr:unnamed protein product [Brassicogethes aeneus]
MVRKRNKRKSRGKIYQSDESDDEVKSDSPVPEEPVQKTYSLRKRSRPNFSEGFEYDLDDDGCIEKLESEDEEFVLEGGNDEGVLPQLELEPSEGDEFVNESTYVKKIEPEKTTEVKPDELIDFEDMIRADIVVNSNIIDYDNLIEKSEIKVLQFNKPIEEKPASKLPGKKRGRKPKNYNETNSVENGHSIFQDLLVPMIESTTHNDSNSSDDLPLAVAFRRQSKSEDTIPNGQNDTDIAAINTDITSEADNLNGNSSPMKLVPSVESQGSEDDVVLVEEPQQIIVLDDD